MSTYAVVDPHQWEDTPWYPVLCGRPCRSKADVYDETGASSCACAARSLSQILTMAAMSSSSSGSMKWRRMASSKVRATFRL